MKTRYCLFNRLQNNFRQIFIMELILALEGNTSISSEVIGSLNPNIVETIQIDSLSNIESI